MRITTPLRSLLVAVPPFRPTRTRPVGPDGRIDDCWVSGQNLTWAWVMSMPRLVPGVPIFRDT